MATAAQTQKALENGKARCEDVASLIDQAIERAEEVKYFLPALEVADGLRFISGELHTALEKRIRRATDPAPKKLAGRIGVPPLSKEKGDEIKRHFGQRRSRENDEQQRAASKARKEAEAA